jgi:hypothetical protein
VDIEIVRDKGHVTITQCVQLQTVIINIYVKDMQHANTNKSLPYNIRNLAHDVKHFRIVLKLFLLLNTFYSSEEYFNCNFNSTLNN